MPRKKNDPDRVIDEEDFLQDAPRPKRGDLPRGSMFVIDPFKDKRKPQTNAQTATHVDALTRRYLGDGSLPKWMKDTPRFHSRNVLQGASRKEVDENAKSSAVE